MKNNETASSNTLVLAAELRAQMSKLRRRLREQAVPGNLTSSQIAVILRLETSGPATVSELSRLEGVRPQSMRNTVISLKKAGYIEGQSDPGDGRKTQIILTEAAHDMMTAGRSAWNDWLASAISKKLDVEEQLLLERAVSLLKRLTEF